MQIGRYQVQRELGRGGMGVVYAAWDPELGRPVAIKRLSALGTDPEALARFAREAELLARVDHPGVVRVHEFGRDPQGPYLVLDLAEGEDLHACYPHGCTAERATELVVALASALEAVHAQGVIHRDLKPQNVLLRPDGSPLLLDFGLARDLDGSRLTKSHEILGTPGYLSPEQVRGGGKACDARADVYGLGGVLFFLLTGRPPFDAAGIVPLLHAVLHDPPAWGDARVPAELRAIADVALAKDPRERFATPGALVDALRVGSAPRRRSLPLLGLGAALGCSALALVLTLALATRPPQPEPDPVPAMNPTPRPEEPAPQRLEPRRARWLRGPVGGEGWIPRQDHALAHDEARAQTVLFGGRSADGKTLGDTWTLEGERWVRRPLPGAAVEAAAVQPYPRAEHTLTYVPELEAVVLCGGEGVSQVLDDVWVWKETFWNRVSLSPLPQPLRAHSATYAEFPGREGLLVFGGYAPDESAQHRLYLLRLNARGNAAWSEVASHQALPSRRAHASFAYLPAAQRAVLFGGRADHGELLGDTWLCDGQDWTELSGAGPPPRWNATLTRFGDLLLLYGGSDADDRPLSDLWTFDGQTWRALETEDPPAPRRRHAAVWRNDPPSVLLMGGKTDRAFGVKAPIDECWFLVH